MLKAIVLITFGLAVCWSLQHWINLSTVAFTLAGTSITWSMLIFCGSVGLIYSRVK